MKGSLRFLLGFIFIILLPIVLLVAVPRLNGYSAESLKASLVKQDAYNQASSLLQAKLAMPSDAPEATPGESIGTVIKDQLTPAYLQTKTELVITQTAVWVQDPENNPEPTLSFNDIQQNLLSSNPELKGTIDRALADLEEAQANGELEAMAAESGADQQQIQQLLAQSQDLEAMANGDWTVSLGSLMAGLPDAWTYYVWGLPIVAVLLALFLAGIFGLGNVGTRWKSVGWVLLLTGIWNGILAAAFWFLVVEEFLLQQIPLEGQESEAAVALVRAVQGAVFDKYVTIQIAVTAVLIVLGAVLMFIGGRGKSEKVPAAKPEKDANPSRLKEAAEADATAAKEKASKAEEPESKSETKKP